MMGIPMTDLNALFKLQSWLSPAFPIGAFSYSSGLEAAIENGYVSDAQSLSEWLTAQLENGAAWNDAVLLTLSWRTAGDKAQLAELSELAIALCFSHLRQKETCEQGVAFTKAARAWSATMCLPDGCPLPVAVGAVAANHQLGLTPTVAAFLHGYISNQIQCALRLMKLGQQGGVELLALLEASTIEIAKQASEAGLEDLCSNTFVADIAAIKHQTLVSRIFIS